MPQNEAMDIVRGLTAPQKRISSKYFYDERGTQLFHKITQTPEYYLTNCEKEILHHHADLILDQMKSRPYNIIELGVGDGSKASILLEKALKQNNFKKYFAIDISKKALQTVSTNLSKKFPKFEPQIVIADFQQEFLDISVPKEESAIYLFLGSSIGNFTPVQAKKFLERMALYLQPGDLLVVGFDLKKAERVLWKAYHDSKGLTAEFNLNLLRRLNRDYGANFNLEKFGHIEVYNPGVGAMESYLISKTPQTVYFEDFDLEIHFEENEMIHTETSYKFTMDEIKELVKDTGLETELFLTDRKGYFTNVLFVGPPLH